MKKSLEEIAYENSLDIVETTSEWNGYPRNICSVIKGFETWEEAEKLASKYNLEIIEISKREGQQLWTRCDRMWQPFKLTADAFGADSFFVSKKDYADEEDFLEKEVKPFIEDICSFDDLKTLLVQREELWAEVCDLNEDEVVLTDFGDYFKVLKPICTKCEINGTDYEVALYDLELEEEESY